MRTAALSILLVAGAALAFPANAQEAPPPVSDSFPPIVNQPADPGWSGWNDRVFSVDIVSSDPLRGGFAALQANDFARAERIFARFARNNRKGGVANFYLGATRMDLGKWEDAKKPLEIAVAKIPEHPAPKSRLGVTHARLGDTAGANAQRADLVKMADACNEACELAPYIMDGIRMIDEALAERPAPIPAP